MWTTQSLALFGLIVVLVIVTLMILYKVGDQSLAFGLFVGFSLQ